MSGRKKLEDFAMTGQYVFHGAPRKIDKLVPMQATSLNPNTGKMVDDGEPAVAATQYLDIAIFRALVNKTNCPENYRSNFGLNTGHLFFKATKETLHAAIQKGIVGYIHVLVKDKFQDYSPKEVRAYSEVKPTEVVEVSPEDLPQNIEIIEI